MQRPRMRPLFRREVPMAAERLMAEIEGRLEARDSKVVGRVRRRHLWLAMCRADRHLWSPYLSVDVLETGPDTSRLRGRYAPQPSLWMFIMAVYGLLGMIALGASMFGVSQWLLKTTPWALWLLPACALGAAATWLAGAVGQRLAEPQMHELDAFFEDCLRGAGPAAHKIVQDS